MDILLLLLGIGLAVSGAHFLVDGGSAIAKRFNIPSLVIGSNYCRLWHIDAGVYR